MMLALESAPSPLSRTPAVRWRLQRDPAPGTPTAGSKLRAGADEFTLRLLIRNSRHGRYRHIRCLCWIAWVSAKKPNRN